MTDYIDKLTHSEPDVVRDNATRNVIGIPKIDCMAIPGRAVSPEEIEDRETVILMGLELPIPFWSDDGSLEPFNTGDFALLRSAGVTPGEWEQVILEEHLERKIR